MSTEDKNVISVWIAGDHGPLPDEYRHFKVPMPNRSKAEATAYLDFILDKVVENREWWRDFGRDEWAEGVTS